MDMLSVDRDGWFCLVDPAAFAAFIHEDAGEMHQLARYAQERRAEHGIVLWLGSGAAFERISPVTPRADRPMRTFQHTVVASHGSLTVPTFKELTGAARFATRRLDTPTVPRLDRAPGRYLVTVAQYDLAPRVTLAIAPARRPVADPFVSPGVVPWV